MTRVKKLTLLSCLFVAALFAMNAGAEAKAGWGCYTSYYTPCYRPVYRCYYRPVYYRSCYTPVYTYYYGYGCW